LVCALVTWIGCSTLPTPHVTKYSFPKEDVYVEEKPKRKFNVLGSVRARVNYNSMNPEREEKDLCQNYYNKAVADLLKRAKKEAKADAVAEVRSVVFFLDGTSKTYVTPECSDDGGEGQVLVQGLAIQWERPPSPTPSLSPQPKK
jgi:hypothetical protein